MGNHLSGTLAIIATDCSERIFIYPLILPLTVYVRYVYDIGTTTPSVEATNILLIDLNDQHPTI